MAWYNIVLGSPMVEVTSPLKLLESLRFIFLFLYYNTIIYLINIKVNLYMLTRYIMLYILDWQKTRGRYVNNPHNPNVQNVRRRFLRVAGCVVDGGSPLFYFFCLESSQTFSASRAKMI